MTQLSNEDLIAVWAGKLELTLKPDAEEYSRGFRGAFTTVLVRCADALQFLTTAVEHVGREGFIIRGIENLFPLRAGHIEVTETIAALARHTVDYPLQWTTFHMFKDD